jgi:ribosomal protein L11 methylase PrmA
MLALYVIGNGVAIVQFTVLIDYGCHAGILSVRVAKLKSSVINES